MYASFPSLTSRPQTSPRPHYPVGHHALVVVLFRLNYNRLDVYAGQAMVDRAIRNQRDRPLIVRHNGELVDLWLRYLICVHRSPQSYLRHRTNMCALVVIIAYLGPRRAFMRPITLPIRRHDRPSTTPARPTKIGIS